MWATFTPKSKNTVSNAPTSIIASMLYQMNHNKKNLDWAKKIYQWEKTHLFDSNTGGVWDHVKVGSDGKAHIKKSWIFIYNEGTFIGAALKLYQITGKDEYLEDAIKAADCALHRFTTNGVIAVGGGGVLFVILHSLFWKKICPSQRETDILDFSKKVLKHYGRKGQEPRLIPLVITGLKNLDML